VGLGLPYLAWMAWKSKEKLIGGEVTSAHSDGAA
jgi:hypothetical protein